MAKKIIFVTGFHRAGTHSYAEHLSQKIKLPCIEESIITWDSWNEVADLCDGYLPQKVNNKKVSIRNKSLDVGFILQCPGLAHKTIELSKLGQVYWMARDPLFLIASMKNIQMGVMAWHLMKGFKESFPDDIIWSKLKYDGSEDYFNGFVDYYALLLKVKEYFYKTRFKSICFRKNLEDQKYYKESQTGAYCNPIKGHYLKIVTKRMKEILDERLSLL